jgi:hypothetical protein
VVRVEDTEGLGRVIYSSELVPSRTERGSRKSRGPLATASKTTV